MDLETITLSDVSQTRQTSYDITCIWDPKKNGTNEILYKVETDSQHRKKFMATKGERRGGINKESGINLYTVPNIK